MVTSLQDKIRSRLQTKVFDRIGKTVSLKSINTATSVYDSRGELTSPAYTTTTTVMVPYDITKDDRLNEAWGSYVGGSTFMAVPYTITIKIDDIVVMEGYNYVVDRISPNFLPDNVVTIVMLNKLG